MPLDAERLARAGNYVLGVMNAEERERAEHDLETDPAFRDAVVEVAERMHLFDLPQPGHAVDRWRDVAARIGEMPHLRAVPGAADTPARHVPRHRRPIGRGAHETGTGRARAIAIAIAVTFALGYVAGRLF